MDSYRNALFRARAITENRMKPMGKDALLRLYVCAVKRKRNVEVEKTLDDYFKIYVISISTPAFADIDIPMKHHFGYLKPQGKK